MFNDEFYPTPRSLVEKMVYKIDINKVKSILEPSGGKGDIADRISARLKANHGSGYNGDKYIPDIDVIEIDENLRHILKGKGHKVVHDDFLTFNTYKQYDVILMNPPFSDGDKHLHKALDMQQNGGIVICILNAETLRNPCTNSRKELQKRLEDYEAEIEYIDNAFLDAERKTDVSIALIKVEIPKAEKPSYIFGKLRREKESKVEQPDQTTYNIINSDFIKGIVERYNFEVKAGIELINEYEAMKPYMLKSFEEKYNSPLLKLDFYDCDRYHSSLTINEFVDRIRAKYWDALFNDKDFTKALTSNLLTEYRKRVETLKDYDFSLFNIYTLRCEMNTNLVKGVEDTILNLFEEFSNKHHYYDEMSRNIWMFSGWKTNKAYKINKKVIIPYTASIRKSYDYKGTEKVYYSYFDGNGIDKLKDAEKVFNYLDGGATPDYDMESALREAADKGITNKIKLKYFTVNFYQKGTCHILFNDLALLDKFNIFGARKRNWLPPSYGKKSYRDMTSEEKTVIDDFQGADEYKKVINDTKYYLFDASKTLMLSTGETA